MLKINLVCVGKIKEKYLTDAFCEYKKRISAYAKFNLIELKEANCIAEPSDSQIRDIIEKEGISILKNLSNTTVIAMCIEGESFSSENLSEYINNLCLHSKTDITFVIGGSWGLSDEVKSRADICISVSKMTFPHQLFRVILAEQIYRSLSILNNSKYHK